MIFLVLGNGKSVIEFTIDGTSVSIKDAVSGHEFKATKEIFMDQAKEEKAKTLLRRKRGEKFFQLWFGDMKKFCSFNTEEEIEEDIIKDYIHDKGWTLIKRGPER